MNYFHLNIKKTQPELKNQSNEKDTGTPRVLRQSPLAGKESKIQESFPGSWTLQGIDNITHHTDSPKVHSLFLYSNSPRGQIPLEREKEERQRETTVKGERESFAVRVSGVRDKNGGGAMEDSAAADINRFFPTIFPFPVSLPGLMTKLTSFFM